MFSTIAPTEYEKTFIFIGGGGTTSTAGTWQAWTKPAGISFVKIIAIGAGGGGGGGYRSGSATNRNGGGGGGSGGLTTAILPADLIDDTIFIAPGTGGAGGTGGAPPVAATAGTGSYVSFKIPQVSRQWSLVFAAGGGLGGPGTAGSSTTPASGGSGGVAQTLINNPISSLGGTFKSFAGGSGGAGAVAIGPVLGGNVTPFVNNIVCGGGGGASLGSTGGTTGTPGLITAAGIIPQLAAGSSGLWFSQPLCGTGGSGGSQSQNGGDAAYGCGGGGGGGGTANANGGRGGDGIVIITCW